MVGLGYLAERSSQNYYWISMIPYLYILHEIRKIQKMFDDKNMPKHAQLGLFFILGWAVYPLAFFAPNDVKFPMYSIADFVNKGIYSLSLYHIIALEASPPEKK
jgi:hypothetical protein